jgi:hypothetical protein
MKYLKMKTVPTQVVLAALAAGLATAFITTDLATAARILRGNQQEAPCAPIIPPNIEGRPVTPGTRCGKPWRGHFQYGTVQCVETKYVACNGKRLQPCVKWQCVVPKPE